ncbi:MAG TPA: hypothetical protein VG052_07690 [Puia sp.]|jgi:hypothetical protein|nr:hypothetical protein [Puia sp.]
MTKVKNSIPVHKLMESTDQGRWPGEGAGILGVIRVEMVMRVEMGMIRM